MLRRCIALLTIVSVATLGCGGRAWPTTAVSASNPAIANALTVDVLPIDVAVWADPGVEVSPEDLRGQLESGILSAAIDTLNKRSYGIDALIDWNGEASGVTVLARDELHATIGALARYSEAIRSPTDMPEPTLPVKLGTATGADATLYVGGWALVAKPRESTGEKVLKGVAIVLAVVAVVAIVAIIADGLGSSSKKESKKGGAAIRDNREEAISSARDHRSSSTTPARDHRQASFSRDHRGSPSFARDHRTHSTGNAVEPSRSHHPRLRSSIGLDLVGAALDHSWHPEPDPDAESGLYLEMTLVDNRTGKVLWHAHQAFPANVTEPADTERAVRIMLASLPTR